MSSPETRVAGRWADDTKPGGASVGGAGKQVFASEDGRVVGLHHNTGQRGGKRLDVHCCIVFAFKDGQIISGREFVYDTHAWDEF